MKLFLSYSKNYVCKFMKANIWHHKLFHFHLSFSVWKVWKGREKITKIWISPEQKELFRWNKKIFHSFWRSIIWWKNKNLMKNSGRSKNLRKKLHLRYLTEFNAPLRSCTLFLCLHFDLNSYIPDGNISV